MSPSSIPPQTLRLPDGIYAVQIYQTEDYTPKTFLRCDRFEMISGNMQVSDHPYHDGVLMGAMC